MSRCSFPFPSPLDSDPILALSSGMGRLANDSSHREALSGNGGQLRYVRYNEVAARSQHRRFRVSFNSGSKSSSRDLLSLSLTLSIPPYQPSETASSIGRPTTIPTPSSRTTPFTSSQLSPPTSSPTLRSPTDTPSTSPVPARLRTRLDLTAS